METDLKHKILFFFMPKNIVFTKKDKNDTETVTMLKAVSPCFYWCSGHEFITEYAENKYLIQHQIYFINGNKIEPALISQHWAKSKNEIRSGIFSFIEMWSEEDHEKVLLTPKYNFLTTKNITTFDYLNNTYKFSEFASFVAKSIIEFKDFYIKQSQNLNFDSIQKEFWRQVALDPKASSEIQKFFNVDVKPKKIKLDKPKKLTKNGKKQKRESTKTS